MELGGLTGAAVMCVNIWTAALSKVLFDNVKVMKDVASSDALSRVHTAADPYNGASKTLDSTA